MVCFFFVTAYIVLYLWCLGMTIAFFFNVKDTGRLLLSVMRIAPKATPSRFLAGNWTVHQFLLHHLAVVAVGCWHMCSWRISIGRFHCHHKSNWQENQLESTYYRSAICRFIYYTSGLRAQARFLRVGDDTLYISSDSLLSPSSDDVPTSWRLRFLDAFFYSFLLPLPSIIFSSLCLVLLFIFGILSRNIVMRHLRQRMLEFGVVPHALHTPNSDFLQQSSKAHTTVELVIILPHAPNQTPP